MSWLFKRLEPYIQAAITKRILKFHNAMIRRGQIQYRPEQRPATED